VTPPGTSFVARADVVSRHHGDSITIAVVGPTAETYTLTGVTEYVWASCQSPATLHELASTAADDASRAHVLDALQQLADLGLVTACHDDA
jgi:hypothetical protein